MKDTKKKIEFFSFYDKTGIEAHLSKMAEEGWLLEKMSSFRWTYRRIEPKKIHFSVSYYATISDFEPEPTEKQQTFNDFCEHSGWKLAASTVQLQVFYNENADPVPIETDPALEVENIHKSVKKTVLVSYICLLFLSFLMGASFISTMLGDPIHLLSSATKLFTGVWWIVACIYSLTELITYFVWRSKAKVMAAQGIFYETRGHRKLGFVIVVFILVSVVIYLISLTNTGLQFFMTMFLLILLAGVVIGNSVKNLMKKKKVKAEINKFLTSLVCLAIGFVLIGSVNYIMIRSIQNGVFENDLNDLPLTIGKLLEIDDSDYIKTQDKEESILLGQYHSSQHPNSYYHTPLMQYTITEIKIPLIYDFVVDQLYHQYDEWRGYDSVYEYVETDASVWGANKAWTLYKDGKLDNAFLVCYDKYVLEISTDWNLNTKQMQTICDSIINKN